MPTHKQHRALSLDEAISRAGRHGFRGAGAPAALRLGGIGLEQELLAISVDATGRPTGRLQLAGRDGVMAVLDRLASGSSAVTRVQLSSGLSEYHLGNGGRLTFEPGAQIELSSTVHPSVNAALADVQGVQQLLADTFAGAGAVIAAADLDLWHSLDAAPQQLQAGRYLAQAEYYEQRGTWGRVMMRHTGSLQLNLDHGPAGVWQERWLLANLLAPLVLATFAASPGPEAVSTRALAWQRLDPTRTGFPRLLVEGTSSCPCEEWAEAALDADVMLVRLPGGDVVTGRAGWSFREWIEQGHPEHGWPTADDLDYHLTTLFFEVRPRGFLELRTCGSLPARWRPAAVVLITALLSDDKARHDALALLDYTRSRLPELWYRAARVGIHDPELVALATQVWHRALAGAARLPREYLAAEHLSGARRYLDRFTFAGRMPADELRELMDDPQRSLAWATDLSSRDTATVERPAPLPVAVAARAELPVTAPPPDAHRRPQPCGR